MKHDTFCWRCCGDNTTFKCSIVGCFRSFHSKCVEKKDKDIDDAGNWKCPVCIELDSTKNADE